MLAGTLGLAAAIGMKVFGGNGNGKPVTRKLRLVRKGRA